MGLYFRPNKSFKSWQNCLTMTSFNALSASAFTKASLTLASLHPLYFTSMAASARGESFLKPFISHDSSQSFAIPLLFNEYFPDPLPINVELLVPCGRSWMIRMKRRGDEVFLTHGWETFVRENNVEDGKLLNFIYDCDRTFRVIVFGHNQCSEFIDLPQAIIDVDDYETGGEEEEEKNMCN